MLLQDCLQQLERVDVCSVLSRLSCTSDLMHITDACIKKVMLLTHSHNCNRPTTKIKQFSLCYFCFIIFCYSGLETFIAFLKQCYCCFISVVLMPLARVFKRYSKCSEVVHTVTLSVVYHFLQKFLVDVQLFKDKHRWFLVPKCIGIIF